MDFKVGDVVCATYSGFDNVKHTGIFLIVYDEQNDSNVIEKFNVVAMKISSQTTVAGNYVLNVDRKKNDWFTGQSIILWSKLHTLDKRTNIYKKLGSFDSNTMLKVFKVYKRFVSEQERQMLEVL